MGVAVRMRRCSSGSCRENLPNASTHEAPLTRPSPASAGREEKKS